MKASNSLTWKTWSLVIVVVVAAAAVVVEGAGGGGGLGLASRGFFMTMGRVTARLLSPELSLRRESRRREYFKSPVSRRGMMTERRSPGRQTAVAAWDRHRKPLAFMLCA